MARRKYAISTKPKTKLPELKAKYDERSLYDWKAIRTDFIEGIQDDDGTYVWPDVKTLAEKYNVPDNQLQNRATRERWKDHRSAHQNQLAIARTKAHAKMLAEKAVKFDEATVEITELAKEHILRRFRELEELDPVIRQNRQLLIEAVEAGEHVRVSDLKASAFSGTEYESLMKALALAAEVGRTALGIKESESPMNMTTNNIEVYQTSIREELLRKDSDRFAELARIMGNPNLSLPALTQGEDIVDAEIVQPELEGIDDRAIESA